MWFGEATNRLIDIYYTLEVPFDSMQEQFTEFLTVSLEFSIIPDHPLSFDSPKRSQFWSDFMNFQKQEEKCYDFRNVPKV